MSVRYKSHTVLLVLLDDWLATRLRENKEMKLFRMRRRILASLMFLALLIVLLTLPEAVHATTMTLIKEHHVVSSFKDPSGLYDGYLVGQTVTWCVHIDVMSSRAPFLWLPISNLTVTDTLPNLLAGRPLYVTYVSGSQNSSSATGAAAFTDFGNGTLLWNFGAGPFITGVLAPPPFGNGNELWSGSVTFNATILKTVPNNTFLANTVVVSYTETFSGVHSAPGASDTIWVSRPPFFVVPEVPLLGTAGATVAMALGLGVYLATRRKRC